MTALEVAIVIIRSVVIALVVLQIVPLLIWLERKGAAWVQNRPGPERAAVGPFRLGGLLHVIADAVKMIFKEDLEPSGVNRFYYRLAPVIVVAVALTTVAVIPWFDTIVLPGGLTISGAPLDINVALLWFFAIVSLTVYGVIFAGWASNNKYSLLGSMRASAAVLSYEIPMGLSVIGAVMYFGTVSLTGIVSAQGGSWFGIIPKWGVFVQPIAALIFIICAFAETNRAPFEQAEGEAEIVSGYHTEYAGMKFGMFFLGEYAAMVVSSCMIITLFFGGWQVPWLTTAQLIEYAKPGTLWILGVGFALALVLTAVFLGYFKRSIGQWKDLRDYEGLIFALAAIGGAATALLLFFVVLAVDLPAWYGPIFAAVVQFHVFLAKILFACWVFVWVRWTLPRFRYDQVMNLGWRTLLPLALVNILLTGILIMVF